MNTGKCKNLIRSVVFLLLLALVVVGVQSILNIGSNRSYQAQRGFVKEPKNQMDGVLIGASNVHAFFQPPFIWNKYGFAIYSYSVDALSPWAYKHMIIEAQKTQPDALYIIVLNSFKDMIPSVSSIHWSADYFPWSANKTRMIEALTKAADVTGLDKMEYYFPIIRFHARWTELETWDLDHHVDGMKGALTLFSSYLRNSKNMTDLYSYTDGMEELSESQTECMEDLLDYCDEEQINALFVTVPQAISDETVLGQLNELESLVQERGYDCLDLMDPAVTGIQPAIDFYNEQHTNVHGSLKVSKYLADYLAENYAFTDKRGLPGWESWDESVELYNDVIGPYTLPFERWHARRSYNLSIPKLDKLKVDGQLITVSWAETEGAYGYDVYRKAEDEYDGYWVYVATVEDGLSLTDCGLFPETKYTYTVVPYSYGEDGSVRYGNFDYTGVSATTGEEKT